ncbi:hypothetical protein M9H77_33915 [Catharanthus roseus]|uniref:Uncharacterized protein n=1 Tax=Catharanthus roseus TaxID=4058 RepID=A0ACB9ZKG6_CATRO|nr:hypothetical protein M9H77_33915 [Catharanthus roseus]
MQDCKPLDTPVAKGDKFNLKQCPNNDFESKKMEGIPYASVFGSLMYAQVCTRPDLAFIVGMLARYLSNPSPAHWIAAKQVMRPLKLFCDNKVAVYFSNNNRSSTKSKYINLKFLVVKERVQNGIISIERIGSRSMLADLLTKALTPKVFIEHTTHMGVVSLDGV